MRPTIVYAQADAHLCEIHQQALAGAGCRVVTVHDGDGALSAADEEGVDLVVLETLLPRRDGFEVVSRLRASDGPGRAVPAVLLCSGRISPEFRRRAEGMGDVVLVNKPVPLDDLISEVRRLIKLPAAGSRGADRMPPRSGSLREVHLGAILHALHGARASGVLFVENGKKKKAIQLRDGYPIAVKSNLVTECLGNMLVRRGQLTQASFEESVQRIKRREGLQGEILVAMEALDEDAVAEALREQAEAKLFEIFEWRRGQYRFRMGKKLRRANTLALRGSPARLIVEGARRHVSLKRVDDFLARHGQGFLIPSESPFHRFQSLDLTEEESGMMASLDASQPLGEYLDAPERVRRILYALAITELLELSSDSREAEESPSKARRPRSSEPPVDDMELRRELTVLARSLRDKNHFEVLDLPTIADDDAVRAAYERQIERVHPDRYQASTGAVRQVADEIYRLFVRAFESIRDAEGRAAYGVELKRGIETERRQNRSKKVLGAETAFQRGEAALRQRDYEGGLVFFGSALEQLPEEGLYHAHYGWCLHLCHPDNEVIIREAIEHVQNGVKLAREHEKPYLFLGRLYKALGRMSAAEKMFTRAVQLRSDCVEALRELRLLNMRREKSRGLFGRILRR